MNVGQLKAELARLPEHLEVFIDTGEAPYWVVIDHGEACACVDRVAVETVRFEGSFVQLQP